MKLNIYRERHKIYPLSVLYIILLLPLTVFETETSELRLTYTGSRHYWISYFPENVRCSTVYSRNSLMNTLFSIPSTPSGNNSEVRHTYVSYVTAGWRRRRRGQQPEQLKIGMHLASVWSLNIYESEFFSHCTTYLFRIVNRIVYTHPLL